MAQNPEPTNNESKNKDTLVRQWLGDGHKPLSSRSVVAGLVYEDDASDEPDSSCYLDFVLEISDGRSTVDFGTYVNVHSASISYSRDIDRFHSEVRGLREVLAKLDQDICKLKLRIKSS